MIIGPIGQEVWNTLLKLKCSIKETTSEKRLEREQYIYRHLLDSFYKH